MEFVVSVAFLIGIGHGFTGQGGQWVISNYYRYKSPTIYFSRNDATEEVLAEPALHVSRAGYQVNNMTDVRIRYVERDWNNIERLPERIGKGQLWGPELRDEEMIDRAKKIEVLVR